ncbi:unnamed protein product [Rotaria sordida]|uniref:NAD(P)(+)--arginine ADP-ribosyltransferase n=1 Tax=Rotaria sordida TaxID=392033 RepID=A0A819P3Z7_9BILA|nr:unnamed protein product [Rotaria sordida]CAF4007287.1 unnamed protein product [Rotaria sordida]
MKQSQYIKHNSFDKKINGNLKSFIKTSADNEEHVRQHSRQDEVSQFYFACKNGDIDTVKQILPTIPYDRLNQLEPNGSTPLHAATYFGHLEIVRLLLHEYGCLRHQQNLDGLTAYEKAQTDEMRQLYHRPSNKNRFFDESNSVKRTFQIVSSFPDETELDNHDNDDHSSNDDDDDVTKPNKRWLTGYQTNEEIKRQLDGLSGVKKMLQSRVGRFIMKKSMKHGICKTDCGYSDEEYVYVANKGFERHTLKKLLDEHVTPDHPEYKRCCFLLNQYIQQDKIESLLTLYSLETPFYQQFWTNTNPLGFPLFMRLSDLKLRHFQGNSYRGINMTHEELNEYRWALKTKDSVISTATFASTSVIRSVAEDFAALASLSPNKVNVLLIFHFSQPCDTAINLSKIPECDLPCISNFEDEYEVLVCPRTFFKVKQIETNELNGQHIIYLENICGEQKSLLGTGKFFIKQELINRFRH